MEPTNLPQVGHLLKLHRSLLGYEAHHVTSPQVTSAYSCQNVGIGCCSTKFLLAAACQYTVVHKSPETWHGLASFKDLTDTEFVLIHKKSFTWLNAQLLDTIYDITQYCDTNFKHIAHQYLFSLSLLYDDLTYLIINLIIV